MHTGKYCVTELCHQLEHFSSDKRGMQIPIRIPRETEMSWGKEGQLIKEEEGSEQMRDNFIVILFEEPHLFPRMEITVRNTSTQLEHEGPLQWCPCFLETVHARYGLGSLSDQSYFIH